LLVFGTGKALAKVEQCVLGRGGLGVEAVHIAYLQTHLELAVVEEGGYGACWLGTRGGLRLPVRGSSYEVGRLSPAVSSFHCFDLLAYN
jgi:hypothetical protein